jgi:tRNA(Ile)-lysidine synthase
MRDLLHRVASFIRTHDLVSADRPVLAAVSGGADSVALAHVLAELERRGALRLAAIIHFNHQLRSAADADEAFVRDLAAGLNVPFLADREDVRARAARERRSLEDAGRVGRHQFFERARVTLAADRVALGHTRDDQAETILLRLVRGAGPRGLSGMHPRTGHVVRPLLDCRRAELRAWLDERGAAHVEDLSNADVAIPRNRVRAELLPLLAERFNPNIVDVLADEAELARAVWHWMDEASAPFLRIPHLIDLTALRAAPAALQRLVVWRALSAASGGRHISFDHVAAVIRLTQSERLHGTLDLPGQTVQRTGNQIVLTNERRSRRTPNLFERALSIPGEAHIPEAGCVVTARDAPAGGGATMSSRDEAFVRRDLVRESLVVRNRRPGDKFRPAGLRGSKKLQDLFVDAKVPQATRDSVPVVVDERDRIVWVAGFGIDEAFRVTDASQAVLVLRLTRS